MKIIFIVGSGHSSSTLLDKTLGSHSTGFSLGEIVNQQADYNLIHPEYIGSLCGCSSLLKECNFWNEILENLKTKEQVIFKEAEYLNFELNL